MKTLHLLTLAGILILVAPFVHCQERALPDAPTPAVIEHRSNKLFWTEVTAYTAANVVDGIETVHNTNRGFSESDFPRGSANLGLGRHPDAIRYVAVEGGIELVTSIAAYKLEHNSRKWMRLLGHAIMVQGIVAHTDGAIISR